MIAFLFYLCAAVVFMSAVYERNTPAMLFFGVALFISPLLFLDVAP